MPTYLIHGFRWSRAPIRIHIIQQDIDDAASEWIVAPATSVALLNSFYSLYDFLPPSSPPPSIYTVLTQPSSSPPLTSKEFPQSSLSFRQARERPGDINTTGEATKSSNGGQESPPSRRLGSSKSMSGSSTSTTTPGKEIPFNDWSVVKFLEQYDPCDITTASQPYAYVGDYMLRIDLGINVADEIGKYEAIQCAEEASINNPTEEKSTRNISRRSKRSSWLEKLRDELEKGAGIRWYVVVCGDEQREVGSVGRDTREEGGNEVVEAVRRPRSAGLRGFFGRRERKMKE